MAMVMWCGGRRGVIVGAAVVKGVSGTLLTCRRHHSIAQKLLAWRTLRVIEKTKMRVHVVTSGETWDNLLPRLISEARREGAVGLDCEWTNTGGKRRPVAILQLATCSGLCVLLRLSQLQPHLPHSLRSFLEDESILKVGVATLDDSALLATDYCLKVRGCVDLRHLALRVNEGPSMDEKESEAGQGSAGLSLNALSTRYLGRTLDKDFRVIVSDWQTERLSEKQIRYAAEDALVGAHLLLALSARLWGGGGRSFYPSYPPLPSPPLLPLLLPPPLFNPHLASLLHFICLPYLDQKFKRLERQTDGATSSNPPLASESTTGPCVGSWDIRKYKKELRYPFLQHIPYSNCKLVSPDGVPLAMCGTRKARWYLTRGLGEAVSRVPFVVRLTFQPAYQPLAITADEPGASDYLFYLTPRENVCVVCGAEEELAKKSVVPHEYRRHFPALLKEKTSHDLVLLCISCHRTAFQHDRTMRETLAKECPPPSGLVVIDPELKAVKNAAVILLHSLADLPPVRVQELEERVQGHYGEVTPATLQAAAALDVRVISEGRIPHGLAVVQMYQQKGGLASLEHRWRSHFIATSRPQYLPQDWSPKHKHTKLQILAAILPPGHPDHTLFASILTGTNHTSQPALPPSLNTTPHMDT